MNTYGGPSNSLGMSFPKMMGAYSSPNSRLGSGNPVPDPSVSSMDFPTPTVALPNNNFAYNGSPMMLKTKPMVTEKSPPGLNDQSLEKSGEQELSGQKDNFRFIENLLDDDTSQDAKEK